MKNFWDTIYPPPNGHSCDFHAIYGDPSFPQSFWVWQTSVDFAQAARSLPYPKNHDNMESDELGNFGCCVHIFVTWLTYVVDRLIFQLIDCFTLSYSSEEFSLIDPIGSIRWKFLALSPLSPTMCLRSCWLPLPLSFPWPFWSLTKGPYVDFVRVALPSLPINAMVKSAEYRLYHCHRGERIIIRE